MNCIAKLKKWYYTLRNLEKSKIDTQTYKRANEFEDAIDNLFDI